MNSEITIEKSIATAKELIEGKFVVTDDNVYKLYKDLLQNAKGVYVMPHGEDSKTLATAEKVLSAFAQARLDRKSVVVALGGGVVGDLTGFAAAVYMRGIAWINVPTTLLACLDSSIGGKTGVDLQNYKNMVGAFHLPQRVAICTDFCKTLPKREILCGLGEGAKSALLDKACMQAFGALSDRAKRGEAKADFYELVKQCALFKQRVVEEDFRESGRRKILNLGHTVGHALEYLDKHRLSHGEYVAVGLKAEAGVALKLGYIDKEQYERIARLSDSLTDNDLIARFSGGEIAAAAKSDKKNNGGKISIVVSKDFEQSEYLLSEDELAREIDRWKSDLSQTSTRE